MGLARAAVHLLMAQAVDRPYSGSIVTLGRQHVYATEKEIGDMAAKVGFQLKALPVELHREPSLASKGYVSDGWLFKSLGFEEIVRVDYSDYEEVDQILDLNTPLTPANLEKRFDVVLDTGTLEHVFDIAAGLRHCVRMVQPGGRVIHLTPTSNCVEHGFYSVSPTLFSDFYSASGFQVDAVWLCEIPIDLQRGTWNVFDYLGSPERFLSLGQLNDNIWFTLSVATATGTPQPAIPQQSFYTTTWENASTASTTETSPDSPASLQFEAGSKSQRLMSMLERVPLLQRTAARGIQKWRRWRHHQTIKHHRLPYPFVGKF